MTRHAATGTPSARPSRRHTRRRGMTIYAEGEPMVWLHGGALAVALLMILFMLAYVGTMGAANFWPLPIVELTTRTGEKRLGEITRRQTYRPPPAALQPLDEAADAPILRRLEDSDGMAERLLVRTGNYDLTGTRFHWVSDYNVAARQEPAWAIVAERMEWGHLYGTPKAFLVDGAVVADALPEVWDRFQTAHPEVRRRWRERKQLESVDIGRTNRRQEEARLRLVDTQRALARGRITESDLAAERRRYEAVVEDVRAEHARVTEKIQELNQANDRYALLLETSDGREKTLQLAHVVRAYPANQLSVLDKLGVFFSRWREFLLDDPREANQEGGVFPAIIGTVTMTLVMTIFVVPFGVLAALYLREYAKSGPLVSSVRIAINNLAGVPSIVFGVFGLGFFCYIFGGTIDEMFYDARLPAPTFRKGGVLWASLTLALLTLPVVIVATEEALAAVPGSMREGSYACGASKWQTIKRIVLPRAMPGIMTGMILAMARGAGEVAPLMLVGAVKLAPDLPVDLGNWSGTLGPIPTGPIHLDRSFMHLGFHIYDVGFQSPDSEAARPMVFTTTLLLIAIVVLLNLGAMWLRTRLKRRFAAGAF